jgi:hypothetical protein
VGRAAAAVSDVYLDASRSGVAWLLDPSSARLAELTREAAARTPDSPCSAAALAADAEALAGLIRARHFGVANGLVEAPDAVIEAWTAKLASGPRTWGEAVTDLQFDLREALGDQHVRVHGAPRWRDGRAEQDDPGPPVEETVVDGVLVLRVRRLIGDPADEALLAAWSADADRHFAHDRIVIDFRGNPGGNDGHTFTWAERRFRAVPRHTRESIWRVQGAPLGNWNAYAWRAAELGEAAVPPHLVAGKHEPRPDDHIELHHEDWALEEGDRPWDGRMLVLVDRRTRSSGESSAWLLRDGLGATIGGAPSTGMIEYGNIVPYVLPQSGLALNLPTKHNDYGFAVESVGFPVDVPIDAGTSALEVAARFSELV